MMPSVPPVMLLHPFDAHAGAQRIGSAFVAALAATGVDVRVRVGFGGRGFLSELPGVRPDVQCDHIPTRKLLYPLWAICAMVSVAWAAARGRVVWANTIHAIAAALLAAMLFPRRTIVHVHEATFPRPFLWLLRLAHWRGASIVYVSADQAARIGVSGAILPNPVHLPSIDQPSRQNRFLFIGTTQPIKGFALFVAVVRLLDGSGLDTVAYLSDEHRHDRALVAAARAAGIEIVFGENSPEVMYRDGFLLLMATDPAMVSETFSLVAAEAIAALVPVGGAGATVLPEVLGEALAFNHANRDPASIAQAIRALLADPEKYAALRRACAERRVHFSEAAFTQRVVRLLQNLEV
jgi:glycosyltransferase involved in cell wall biosynthesis